MNATTGPWIGKTTSGDQGLIYSEDDGRNVAVAYDARDTDLIASAPELLEALRNLSDATNDTWRVMKQRADAVIAKAEGK